MRAVFVLAMRVASYWCVEVLKPVHASVVNGVPFSAPSICSSTNVPSKSDRIVDVPFVATPGAVGLNQNTMSTSQVPHIAARRACSGAGAATVVAVAAIATAAAITAITRVERRIIGYQLL